ncbi:alpha-mannosidase [Rosettibacter firmus]|uniref:alpha-mannosidase n=1 Tax=Rosettibacter firmus TaxID=3111522 RepID=UPI00336BE778
MNKKIFFLLIFFHSVLFAQSKIDLLINALDSLSEVSFDNWKYSTDFSLTPEQLSQIDFNDSSWKTAKLNERLQLDSCWFRKIIVIPSFIAGTPVKGRIKFFNSVDDFSYMWINGQFKGKFPWDGEVLLTDNAIPEEKYVILIKAINTGGPLRLIRAKLDFEIQTSTQKLMKNLSLSFKVARKLLSFDTYQTNARVKTDPKIDLSKFDKKEKQKLNTLLQNLASEIDLSGLNNGDTLRFINSVNKVLKKLEPVKKFVKNFTLQFASNAHIDAAWLWRKKETEEVCKRTFSAVMNMFNARPDFTYTQSQAAFYNWMKKDYPDLFDQIKNYVKKGRWEISGGMWVEPDCNLPSGDSWIRQILYGQKFFQDNFGIKARIGWNPDSFGYNWNLPQFMLLGGLDAFITQKIGWNDTNVFPYRLFWWQAPDGSKILTYFPFDYVNTIDNPFQLVDWLRQFEANTGFTKLLVLFGVGDHGGGPSLEMMARIDELKNLFVFPNIEFNTAQNYIDWLRKHDLSKLPIWNDELYLEYHRGTATTQSNIKMWNRKSEVLLTNAEKFSSISQLLTKKDYHPLIKEAWKNVLFNQFHDILPGSGIREIYIDAENDYKESYKLGNFVLKNSLKDIAKKINTSIVTEGKALIVFNPLSWERTDIVKFQLNEGDFNGYEIFDLNGNKIPSQTIQKDLLTREILFIAQNIPALGYRTFVLKQSDLNKNKDEVKIEKDIYKIENELFHIKLNPETGWIKSIYDKRFNKELLADEGNKLQILEDKPSAWDAWNIGLTGIEYPSKFRKAELVENGPVRKVLRCYRDYLKPGVVKEFPTEDFPNSFFVQDIILYDGMDRIDFKTSIEWWENKTMLKVSFPFNVYDTLATYEIPFGFIKRSTTLKAQWDKGKWEVNAQKWADLSDDNFGISLLNRSKYGYDTKGNIMRLSLLRSPQWPDPTADRGNHSFEYSLYPHEKRVEQSETVFKGYEFNYPLLCIAEDLHSGDLPETHSFIQINPENAILTSMKQSEEDANAFLITIYESTGKDSEVELSLPFNPSRVYESNILEENLKEIQFTKNTIRFSLKKNSIKILKVIL